MAWEGQQAVREQQGSPTKKLTLIGRGEEWGLEGAEGGGPEGASVSETAAVKPTPRAWVPAGPFAVLP